MEKVKIIKCIKKDATTKDGKPIYEIELADGRKGAAFDSSFAGLPLNQDIDIDVVNAKDYNNEKRYIFNVPGQKSGGKYPQKDWTFEKRRASLDLSIQWCKSKEGLRTEDVINCASVFLNYLNPKE